MRARTSSTTGEMAATFAGIETSYRIAIKDACGIGAAKLDELIRFANQRNVVAQILVQICEPQKELQELFFFGGSVVTGAFGEKLDGEFGLHVKLIECFLLNRMAFAAKGGRRLQLVHGAIQIVLHAQRFLRERGRHGARASWNAARKLGYYSQNCLLDTIPPLRIEQSAGQTPEPEQNL